MVVEDLLQKVTDWAETNQYINAIALVGSYARGEATPDSDVDIVLVCSKPLQLLYDLHWLNRFGDLDRYDIEPDIEQGGKVNSVRAIYKDFTEIEFSITDLAWAALPIDPGTKAVIAQGVKIILDKTGVLKQLLAA